MSNEEIKEAVLAECQRLAPIFGVSGTIFGTFNVSRWFDGTGWSIYQGDSVELCHVRPDINCYNGVWELAYRLLGLGERRLAEELEALREKARLYDEAEGALGKMIEILKRKREELR